MDESTITQLLNSANSGTGTSVIPDFNAIIQSLAPYMIALSVVSVLITILYIVSVIGKWRANKAIIDIKKILIEMNERDKLRMAQTIVVPAPTPKNDGQSNAPEISLPITSPQS